MANSPMGKMWLALPWIILALGAPVLLWWLLEPVPIEIAYVAPSFLSHPAQTREEAVRYYVSEVEGGDVLYRFVSYCVSKPFIATSRRAWIGRAISWSAPDLPTYLSRTPGCFETSVPVEIPSSSPTRRFEFVQVIEIPLNPLRTVKVEFAPIALTILAPAECKK